MQAGHKAAGLFTARTGAHCGNDENTSSANASAALSEKGFEAHGFAADATDPAALTETFERIAKRFGAVDVLIYNAAVMDAGKTTELTAERMLAHFAVDVAGAQHCVRQVLPGMLERKTGAILFTGGLFGVFPNADPNYAYMSMDKAALRTLAQMLNESLKGTGVYAGIVNIMSHIGSTPHFAAEKIADAYWNLYQDQKDFEVCYR